MHDNQDSPDPWLAEHFSAAAKGGPRPSQSDTEETLVRLLSAIAADEAARTATAREKSRQRATRGASQPHQWRSTAIRFAAVCAAIILGGFGWRFLQSPSRDASITRTYATAAGQTASVRLTDGSEAALGPATTLRVVTNAPTGTTVTISGEAVFSVRHHANVPFVVRAGSSEARVLGTRFSVRRYPTDRDTRIMVADGRVSVEDLDARRGSHASVLLSAGMLAVASDSGRTSVTSHIPVDDYLGWTNGRLVFRDTPVSDLTAELERTYDVEIRVSDSTLAARKLTWVVPVSSLSIDDAMRVLTDLLDAHYVRSGRTVTLLIGRPTRGVLRRTPITPREKQYGK